MLTFTRVMKFTKIQLVLNILMVPLLTNADWTVDFSRRSSQMGNSQMEAGQATATPGAADTNLLGSMFQNVIPTEEVVILNTEQGFIPATVRVREGVQYKFIVVNVNEKAKNVSFVMDAFSEHHSTFYGKLKSFFVVPKKVGVYTFVSPETSAQGRLVVQGLSGGTAPMAPTMPDPSVELRTPASIQSTNLGE